MPPPPRSPRPHLPRRRPRPAMRRRGGGCRRIGGGVPSWRTRRGRMAREASKPRVHQSMNDAPSSPAASSVPGRRCPPLSHCAEFPVQLGRRPRHAAGGGARGCTATLLDTAVAAVTARACGKDGRAAAASRRGSGPPPLLFGQSSSVHRARPGRSGTTLDAGSLCRSGVAIATRFAGTVGDHLTALRGCRQRTCDRDRARGSCVRITESSARCVDPTMHRGGGEVRASRMESRRSRCASATSAEV